MVTRERPRPNLITSSNINSHVTMRRLSRLLSFSSVAPEKKPQAPSVVLPSPLLDLPVEILVAIEALLPYENAVAFSLTCKAIYDLFFKLHKPSHKHQGREAHLLRLVERDLPNHLSCPVHERLYSWRKAKAKHYQCPLCTSNKRLLTGSLVICNKGCRSSFYGIFEPERRLMLRQELLGREFGIPKRVLDHVCKQSLSKRANEMRPKIVKGSLMVWRIHHYTVRIDCRTWADLGLEYFDEAICVHSETGLQALLGAATEHVQKRRETTMVKLASTSQVVTSGHWQCPTLFKCQTCATDVRLRMDQVSTNELIVRFDVYQDLGGLIEPTLAQRQVLGAKHDWRQQDLSLGDKVIRCQEDLERRYHSEGESQHADYVGSSSLSRKHIALINQWTYSLRRNPTDPVSFRVDPILSTLNQEQFREVKFIPQKIGISD